MDGPRAYLQRPFTFLRLASSIMPVRALLRLVNPRQAATHRIPDGQRIYAVGDIHGRLDLLDDLLTQIAADDAARSRAQTEIVFLGDLVDRGPDSRGVVDRLLSFSKGPTPARFLLGNHEEVFLRALTGDLKALRFFGRIGGRETIRSYGFSEEEYRGLDYEALSARLVERVPTEHIAFLSSFEDMIEIGDYLFVHAGIRPGVDFAAQETSDLRWIREDFLRCKDSFGKFIIHGHTITEAVDVQPNRIGIDTGAFDSGRLTAIGLEGADRWFLETGAAS